MKPILHIIILLASLTTNFAAATDTLPQVSTGKVERLTNFQSQHVPARNIDIWLPDGYPNAAPYAVLYMHDGQMLYDANTTWNKQEWRVDEVAGELIASGKTRPFIVVGVWNAGVYRAPEYFPQKAFESLDKTQQDELLAFYANAIGAKGPVYSDRYVKFLVTELKLYIDTHYAVSAKRDDTFLMGSSMGGLISMYAMAEYPQVFGAAACLSTHWPGKMGDSPSNPVPAAFLRYIDQHFPAPGKHRIYFDHGTETLDASYADRQREVDLRLEEKGYNEMDWLTRTYPGADHSENAWAERLNFPMVFLISANPSVVGDEKHRKLSESEAKQQSIIF